MPSEPSPGQRPLPELPELAASSQTTPAVGLGPQADSDGSCTEPMAARWADQACAVADSPGSTASGGMGWVVESRAARSALTRASRSWA